MRTEKDSDLRFELTLSDGESLFTGETVNCSVRRISDGFWWDVATTSFKDATYRTNEMTELTGNDGVTARYQFTVPATNEEDSYHFRVRHTMPAASSESVFEVEIETYSEVSQPPKTVDFVLPGTSVRLVAFLQEGGIPLTGLSLGVSIQRLSDNRWWSGVVWHVSHTTVAMTEQTGNVAVEGEYHYSFPVPTLPASDQFLWSVKYSGPPAQYIKGCLLTANVNIERIATSQEAASDLKLAVQTVVAGKAVAGVLTLTEMTTDLAEVTDNHFKGGLLRWTSGSLKDQASEIISYNGTTKQLTFKQVTDIPRIGDTFVIV